MSRDWPVELKEATVAAGGGIACTEADDTVWTRNGTAAAASGALCSRNQLHTESPGSPISGVFVLS